MDYLLIRCPDQMMNSFPEIRRVTPLDGYKLRIEFADGAEGVHDASWTLERSTQMNAPLRDATFFSQVFVRNGALTWPNGFDLSPWNIRKRMEDSGELAVSPAQAADPGARENADIQRVQDWFAGRNIDAQRVKPNRSSGKTPDLELKRDGKTVGWCEVKSRQPPRWRAIYEDEPIYEVGAQGADPSFNSIAKYVMTAHEQLQAIDPRHDVCWVVAIVNHDDRIDVFDLRETLTGNFFANDGKRYATMKGVSEGSLKQVKFDIDLYLWIEDEDAFPVIGEAEPARAATTRELFDLNGPRVLWSA